MEPVCFSDTVVNFYMIIRRHHPKDSILVDSKGFWRLCITLRTTSSIDRYSKQHTRAQRFGNRICFRPQNRRWETPTPLGPLEIVQWLKLGLFNGPNRIDVSHPLTWGRTQIQFAKCFILFCSLEYRMMDKVQKHNSSGYSSYKKRITNYIIVMFVIKLTKIYA
jgi:hypothetical protein